MAAVVNGDSEQNTTQHGPQTTPAGHVSPAIIPENTSTPTLSLTRTSIIDPKDLKRVHSQKMRILGRRFGNIPDVPIFTRWDKRMDCVDSAVHRAPMAGIYGNGNIGAYSVVLSDPYKDDEDGGDVIIYTGAGGRKQWTDDVPPKRLRVGPQTEDQSWDHPPNKALMTSSYTGNPVRVVRSWRCYSQYAPMDGYRYDGLYKVVVCWTATGVNTKKICRCRLERLPGQPPIPLRPITFNVSRRRPRERLVSASTSYPSTSTNHTGVGPDEADTILAQLSRRFDAESDESPTSRQLLKTPEISTADETGIDAEVPKPPSHELRPAVPRYVWDSENHKLVKLPIPSPALDRVDIAERDEEENRGEDDTTLVSSEDDHTNEHMETDHIPESNLDISQTTPVPRLEA